MENKLKLLDDYLRKSAQFTYEVIQFAESTRAVYVWYQDHRGDVRASLFTITNSMKSAIAESADDVNDGGYLPGVFPPAKTLSIPLMSRTVLIPDQRPSLIIYKISRLIHRFEIGAVAQVLSILLV